MLYEMHRWMKLHRRTEVPQLATSNNGMAEE
jgi:hypothetical protein